MTHLSAADYFLVIPLVLGVAFMLWFLWNVTRQMKP